MKKLFSFVMVLVVIISAVPMCFYATDEATVSQVEQTLREIDTLEQMQDKRSKYTAGGHYDISTTNTDIITKHNTARGNYEEYLAVMFEKRAEAQKAYNALSDEEKAQFQ